MKSFISTGRAAIPGAAENISPAHSTQSVAPSGGKPPRGKGRQVSKSYKFVSLGLLSLLVLGLAGYFSYKSIDRTDEPESVLVTADNKPAEALREPKLTTATLLEGRDHIWDMTFVSKDVAIFDERNGTLSGINVTTKETWQITKFGNVQAEGEGGLLGIAVDVDFANNGYMYACYNSTGAKRSVRVSRFVLSKDFKTMSGAKDIISDIESQGGRHSGCRVASDLKKNIWVVTGDSALPGTAQNPKSLAGKVLRVNQEGKGVEGNMPAPFDNRIYSYGHRNMQGIALLSQPLSNGAIGLTSEHGPDKQDEVNWLLPGNFGWDPTGKGNVYNEDVVMTDLKKYPDAVVDVWDSGDSTVAISGIAFLTGTDWNLWRGWTAIATLKGEHVRLLNLTGDGTVNEEKKVLQEFGRIRSVVEGPDGKLYLTTDNGNNADKIIQVTPS